MKGLINEHLLMCNVKRWVGRQMYKVACSWNQREDFRITQTENQIIKMHILGSDTYPAHHKLFKQTTQKAKYMCLNSHDGITMLRLLLQG